MQLEPVVILMLVAMLVLVVLVTMAAVVQDGLPFFMVEHSVILGQEVVAVVRLIRTLIVQT